MRSIQEDPISPKMQDLYGRLLACCHKVWIAVRSVLCYDAPEGHLLYDNDEDDEDDTDHKSKDKLSYCWRALKESRSVDITLDERTMN